MTRVGRVLALAGAITCALAFPRAIGVGVGPAGAVDTGHDPTPLERRVKAAFLYKFGDYVEWPPEAFPEPDAPIVFAVAGDAELARELETIVAGRRLRGHPVRVERVEEGDPLEGVHALFVGQEAHARLRSLLESLPTEPILAVSEMDGALDEGSVINFVLEEGRVRFDVSLDAAATRRLRLSARLLTVARNVEGAR